MRPEDIAAALKSQGVNPLTDTMGVDYAASPVWEQSGPDAIIQYILSLAARKGASDVHIEPTEDAISVKYRIDGFFFRVDPIPKRFQPSLTQKLFEVFRLDPAKENRPQTSRTTGRLADADYDLVAQTLPTAHGVERHDQADQPLRPSSRTSRRWASSSRTACGCSRSCAHPSA